MRPSGMIFLALFWTAHAQAGLSATAKADLEAYCAKIAKAAESRAIKPRFFVDLGDGQAEAERWTEFKSQKAIDKACKDKTCYQTAWVYAQGGHLVLAAFTLASPSGDWANNVDYYFYPNGQTAKDRSELRRFGALDRKDMDAESFLVEVLRTRYYDKQGRALPEGEPRYFKVEDKSKRSIDQPNFGEGNWPQYKRVQDLPMAKALNRQ